MYTENYKSSLIPDGWTIDTQGSHKTYINPERTKKFRGLSAVRHFLNGEKAKKNDWVNSVFRQKDKQAPLNANTSFNALSVLFATQRTKGYNCNALMEQYPFNAALYNNNTNDILMYGSSTALKSKSGKKRSQTKRQHQNEEVHIVKPQKLRRKKKDPNAPKRPMSGFMFFMVSQFKNI